MELDLDQKKDFMNYWGECPLVNREGEFCVITAVEKQPKNVFTWYGYRYEHDPNSYMGLNSAYKIKTNKIQGTDLEVFEPIFIEPGFYQTNILKATYICKRPERSTIKGITHLNTEFLGIPFLKKKDVKISFIKKEYNIHDIFCIWKKLPHHFKTEEENYEQAFKRYESEDGFSTRETSCALSRNVALANTDYDVPLVFYKTTPVGHLFENVIYLAQDKRISKETLEEETGLKIELY